MGFAAQRLEHLGAHSGLMAQRGPLDPFSNDLTGEPIDVTVSIAPTDFSGGSIRRFTQRQFASKIAIVGSSIDRALRDLQKRYQSLQPQDIGKRWVHVVRTGGFSPSPVDTKQPWLPYLPTWNGNSNNEFDAGSPANLYRFKGTAETGTTVSSDADTYNQTIWTQQFYFRYPARLIAVNWNALSCGANGSVEGLNQTYQDPFFYPAPGADPPPPPTKLGGPATDLYLDVSITNRFYPQDMTKAETMTQRVKISAANVLFSHVQPAVDYDTAYPVYPMDNGNRTPYGIYIDLRNLNIPIPEFSVVRLGIIGPTVYPGYGPAWTLNGHVTSWTLTTAEALR